MRGMGRVQLSTDYLVVLALVGILTLILFMVIGGFVELGRATSYKLSKLYWNSADIGLATWRLSERGESKLMLVNNMQYNIRIKSIMIGEKKVDSAGNVVIESRRGKTIKANLSNICVEPRNYSLPVIFVYDDVEHGINGIRFRGDRNLEGRCEP